VEEKQATRSISSSLAKHKRRMQYTFTDEPQQTSVFTWVLMKPRKKKKEKKN
jgi:hypothetical protein